ncbi:DUF3800 domain-containing protein [Ferruginibacter albus]|uniref:DUF3800 domain-containing protein n=1 Tax=Ferruginibacter albus TaxID=2875540 RepID=UPI001CC59A77|nr:DUF3800 domain-containing protein [Ferruginibacter albus]UAY53434.1 DUF3800 domain-containing protein [Ferruginibacter albus]
MKYIFIDESGDPEFYGTRKKLLVGTDGFQPYLLIGMIETDNRRRLRKTVLEFINNIKTDKLYNSIPSINKKNWYVHARNDHPEIRAKFFELLRNLEGYKAHIVVAKKELSIFENKHNSNPTEFYFDVLHHLLNGRFETQECHYKLYLSQRDKSSLPRFQEAVIKAMKLKKTNFPGSPVRCNLEIVPNTEMPELSIIDYLMWAVQRKLLKNESRYFDALENKYETILDLYEDKKKGSSI